MCSAGAATTRRTRAATPWLSRWRRWARAGTTTITITRPRPARASAGGRSTRPTACSGCSRSSASCATCASLPRRRCRRSASEFDDDLADVLAGEERVEGGRGGLEALEDVRAVAQRPVGDPLAQLARDLGPPSPGVPRDEALHAG